MDRKVTNINIDLGPLFWCVVVICFSIFGCHVDDNKSAFQLWIERDTAVNYIEK